MTRHAETIALAGLIVLSLLPLWLFAFIPTLDGPVHVYIAHALAEWNNPGLGRLHQIFELNLRPEPNWTIYVLFEGLMKIFSVHTSERILLSTYVVAMPLSFVAFARMAGGRNISWLAGLLAIPLVYNATFYFGFYNFCLSLPLFVLCTGLFLKYLEAPSLRIGAILAVASFVLYFTHIVGWAAFGMAGAALYLWRVCVLSPAEGRLKFAVRLAAQCALPVLPVVLLVLLFMQRNEGGVLLYAPAEATLSNRIRWLATGSVLFGNSLWELGLIALSFAFAGALAIFSLRKRAGGLVLQDGLLLGTLFLIVTAFAIPDMLFGGGWTAIRIQIFVFILPLMWLAANLNGPLRRLSTGLAISGALLLLVEVFVVARLSEEFGHIVAAEAYVQPNRTILPVTFDPNGEDEHGLPASRGVAFLLHSYARIATDRDLIPLRVHQAWTLNFPLHYNPKTDPYEHLRSVRSLLGSERNFPKVIAGLPGNIASYETQTGQTVDYVLVIGTQHAVSRERTETVVGELRQRYRVVAQSAALPGYVLLGRNQ